MSTLYSVHVAVLWVKDRITIRKNIKFLDLCTFDLRDSAALIVLVFCPQGVK